MAKAGRTVEAAGRRRTAAAKAGKYRCAWLGPWLLSHAAETLADVREWKEADGFYQEALTQGSATGPTVKAQLLQAWAGTFVQRSDWASAEKYYREAVLELQRADSETLALAKVLGRLGAVAQSRGDFGKAREYHRQALAIQEKLAPRSLDMAATLHDLGNIADALGGLDEAEEYDQQALAIRERLTPGSLVVAASLNTLGIVYAHRGNWARAEKYFRRALAIREKLAPGSLTLAAVLNNLGGVANDSGDIVKAEEYHRRVLAIREKLAPGSLSVASSLNNLGLVAYSRGELAKAEEYYRKDLAITEKLSPESLRVAASLNNLGLLLYDRGELDKADEYHRRALSIREKLTPGSLDAAGSLNNLGMIAHDRGDLAKAEEYHREALAIQAKLAPSSHDLALSLGNLGYVAEDRGDLVKAEEYYRQAAAILEKLSPGSRGMAQTIHHLGDMARRRNDPVRAEAYYRRALEIRQKLAPDSDASAETLAALARLKRDNGQQNAAGGLFQEALNALEGQTARLGGSSEVRSSFRASQAGYYAEYVDLLMSQNQPKLAFQVLERSRARTLLETLREGHLDIRQGVDPSLVEQERSLQAALRAKTNRRIELAEGKQAEEQATVNKEIDKLLAQYDEIEGRIRTTSPKYAALTQPQPLTTQAMQQLLDTDSVLLEYALGQERSYVFAVTPTTLSAYALPKREEIESTAQHVYELVTSQNRWITGESIEQRRRRIAKGEAEYWTAASKLSSMVLGPVAAQIEGKRLLIVSDGTLQYLPFAILPVAEAAASVDTRVPQRGVPLVAGHEIVNLPSASVLAVLRQEQTGRGAGPRKTVAVLADPVFDRNDPRVLQAKTRGPTARPEGKTETTSLVGDRLTRSMGDVGLRTAGGLSLPRLAFSRREAAAILALTAKGRGLEAVDFQASRETATSPELAQYRIVHFATHGLLDNRHPELSGLVFSLVDEQGNGRNGFLDLADVYNLSLPVDLVVLSACETGLGKEMGAEGLVGLTRGFMYAGAPRVMASLWKVDDVATAKLMESFYRAMLKDGKTPAAALRQAQLDMWKQQRWADPCYWGAFRLQGEWR